MDAERCWYRYGLTSVPPPQSRNAEADVNEYDLDEGDSSEDDEEAFWAHQEQRREGSLPAHRSPRVRLSWHAA